MKVKIFTVTHKAYWFPEDSLYEPIQVGFKADLGILRDNIGDNISSKNKHYCELTALYWIYKNIQDLDYIGLDHYRRHFVSRVTRGDKQDKVLKESELVKYLNNNTVIVPKHRNYFIETNYSHYVHSQHEID